MVGNSSEIESVSKVRLLTFDECRELSQDDGRRPPHLVLAHGVVWNVQELATPYPLCLTPRRQIREQMQRGFQQLGHFLGIGVKGGGNVMTTFQFQIEGYYQLDDGSASEETFRDLVWGVADELNAYGALGIAGVTFQTPADVEQFGYIMLANYALFHYGRIGVGFNGRTRPT